MSDQKNLEPDLDFLRYADDVRESKSLKKFIDSGKEKRFRIRTKENRLEIKILSKNILYHLLIYVFLTFFWHLEKPIGCQSKFRSKMSVFGAKYRPEIIENDLKLT